MRPRCVAVVTRDPALYADLVGDLRERRIPTVSLVPGERIPERAAAVLTTPTEAASIHHPNVVPVPPDADRTALWALVEALLRAAGPGELVLGIDPGPRPGYAVVVGESKVAGGNLETPEDVVRLGHQLKRAFRGRSFRIRVGSGDRPSRDRIVNALSGLHHPVELVNEAGTTPRGRRRPRDAMAAATIARIEGRPISGRVPVAITPGDIANLQRLSREHSGGRLTISRTAADRVLRGELTIGEALEVRRSRRVEAGALAPTRRARAGESS
ncbi:MAG: hypothetical protein L3K15_07875 [Thermoplasmata archaeon]|nr:hypothetical protein [Thermoplasmata archaeon]